MNAFKDNPVLLTCLLIVLLAIGFLSTQPADTTSLNHTIQQNELLRLALGDKPIESANQLQAIFVDVVNVFTHKKES